MRPIIGITGKIGNKLTFSDQHDIIFSRPIISNRILDKPIPTHQNNLLCSNIFTTKKRNLFFDRNWNRTDLSYAALMIVLHGLACCAPFTFSWPMFWLFIMSYIITGCLGITLSYHRQLSHKSFKTPKWLEYIFAFCGVLSIQGDPIEWVSSHRYHHLHTDTPLDPHSPYEGFWWSHMGWLLDNKAAIEKVGNRNNAADMMKQPFYEFMEKTYSWHIIVMFSLLFILGGIEAVIWGGALRCIWVYHVTWAVNSIAHIWGDRPYETGDLSTNNWLVGLLAFGEGWHCNHHKYEFSARHGLEWWQIDFTWYIILILKNLKLAYDIRLPTPFQIANKKQNY